MIQLQLKTIAFLLCLICYQISYSYKTSKMLEYSLYILIFLHSVFNSVYSLLYSYFIYYMFLITSQFKKNIFSSFITINKLSSFNLCIHYINILVFIYNKVFKIIVLVLFYCHWQKQLWIYKVLLAATKWLFRLVTTSGFTACNWNICTNRRR